MVDERRRSTHPKEVSNMKKLYSVRNRKLVEANVVRETPLYYFVDTAELTNWGKRLNRSEVDGSPRFGRLVASTPKGAWEKEQHHQREIENEAQNKVYQAQGALQVAQLALDAIRAESVAAMRADDDDLEAALIQRERDKGGN